MLLFRLLVPSYQSSIYIEAMQHVICHITYVTNGQIELFLNSCLSIYQGTLTLKYILEAGND